MAKVYIIDDGDIAALRAALDRDPRSADRVKMVGGTIPLSDLEQQAHDRAQRHLTYHVCEWIERVTK